jgi:hypothetical protein
MAMDKRTGNTPPAQFKREAAPVKLDAGPYIGKIKNNLDPTRSGRLQVYLPDVAGGDEENPDNWRTVAYASPFFGSTTQPDKNKQNSFKKVKHTYGFWAVPPDVGNLVLCLFVAGDPSRGFWFACVPNQLGHHMVPGIAGSTYVETETIENKKIAGSIDKSQPTVVSEFNENAEEIDWENFVNAKKPLHEEQYKIYAGQGLENDYVRGIISSSSQREAPSYVFGISTPGRPLYTNERISGSEKTAEQVKTGAFDENEFKVSARTGGHQFVMDDGNFDDKDRLIRLRSSSGHQILMNDSEKILYIANAAGTVWLEMTAAGHLHIYSGHSVNVRARGDINLHADRNINMNAGGAINMNASNSINEQAGKINLNASDSLVAYGGKTGIGSSGSLAINANGTIDVAGVSAVHMTGGTVTLNDGIGDARVDKPDPIKINKLPETGVENNKWKSVDGGLDSIVPIAPTHEPWALHSGTKLASTASAIRTSTRMADKKVTAPSSAEKPFPNKDLPIVLCQNKKPEDPGPIAAYKCGVQKACNKSYMSRKDNPEPPGTVGPLTALQTKALMTQIAFSESSYTYNIENQYSYLGKYQMGAAALVDQSYIKRDAYLLYGNKAVNYPNSWTGKDGITSKETFLRSDTIQEKAMFALLKTNYSTLIRIGGIKEGDDQCTIAGMLTVAHLIGAGGAKKWRLSAAGGDANGTTGTSYYNMGRYAVDVLAATA